MNNSRYSDDELFVCRNTDLVCVCESLGYHVKKSGQFYMVKEMDSLMIKNRKSFIRYSNNTHGSPIDFLMEIQKMSWQEAVGWLLDFNGINRENKSMYNPSGVWFEIKKDDLGKSIIKPLKNINALQQVVTETAETKPEFVLPDTTEPDKAKQYLTTERMISEKLIDDMIRRGLVMEDKKHHNVIFIGKDDGGNPRHASVRGTNTPPDGKAYKGTITGSDTSFSFNIVDKDSDCLAVFEAPIDALSFFDLKQLNGTFRGNYLALTGVHDKALERFLTDYSNIRKIYLCLDQDEAGNLGCKKIIEKYTEWKERKFEFHREIIPNGCKDWNEYLVNEKNKN